MKKGELFELLTLTFLLRSCVTSQRREMMACTCISGVLWVCLLAFLFGLKTSQALPASSLSNQEPNNHRLTFNRRSMWPMRVATLNGRDAVNATADLEMVPAELGDDIHRFLVPETILRASLRRLSNGMPINRAYIKPILDDTRAELRKQARAAVTPTKLFRARHGDVTLTVGRVPDREEYPNLYCGDVVKVIDKLRKVIQDLDLHEEFDLDLFWANGELIGHLQLFIEDEADALSSEGNQTDWADTISSNAVMNATLSSPFDNSIDVPGSNMRVHLLPSYGMVKLSKTSVISCFAAMQKEIGLHATEEAVTQLSVRAGNVQLTLATMVYRATNLSVDFDLTHKEALKINTALAGFVTNFEEIYTMGYQVLRNPYFVAHGALTTMQRLSDAHAVNNLPGETS